MRARIVSLAAATVLLGGLATWFGVAAHGLRTDPAASNTALTDNAGTSELNGEITNAVNTVFSYNYTNVGRTQQAAQRLLTGKAIHQYDSLFRLVRQQAPQQKLVLTTTVIDSGVEMLQGDRARVLLFANQSDTRTALNGQTSYAAAMLTVEAVLKDGAWRISDITAFGSA